MTWTQICSSDRCIWVGKTSECLARSGGAQPAGREQRAGPGVAFPGSHRRHLLEPGGGLAKLSSTQGWGLSSSARTPLLAADLWLQILQNIFSPTSLKLTLMVREENSHRA